MYNQPISSNTDLDQFRDKLHDLQAERNELRQKLRETKSPSDEENALENELDIVRAKIRIIEQKIEDYLRDKFGKKYTFDEFEKKRKQYLDGNEKADSILGT